MRVCNYFVPKLADYNNSFYKTGTNGEGNVLPAEGNKYRDIWKQVG